MGRHRNDTRWKTSPFMDKRSPRVQAHNSALLNLLLVSRQFSDEVAIILFSKPQFWFNCPEDLWHVDRLGQKQQHLITSVLLYLEFSPNRTTSWTDYIKPAKSLLQLQGLKTIIVIISEGNRINSIFPRGEAARFSEKLSQSKALPALESATISVVSYSRELDHILEYAGKDADWYLGKVRDLILGDL